MIIQTLQSAGVAHPPNWLASNTHYLTVMGSVAYGVSANASDIDLYGFAIPPKDMVFPHLRGEIHGFGTQHQRFDVWQEHHLKAPDSNRMYDFSVYSIVRFFHLCMQNNPNMIDSLFTDETCVIHSTQVGQRVRERRREFLHKGSWDKFKGYAYAQMGKIRSKSNASNEKRASDIAEHGFDLKFAYHVVRLLAEVEQILTEHDLDLRRNAEMLKSIRRGEWTLEQIEEHFADKRAALETVYTQSTLPVAPDENRIKGLLLECLEHHYGSLDAVIVRDQTAEQLVRDLDTVLARYRP